MSVLIWGSTAVVIGLWGSLLLRLSTRVGTRPIGVLLSFGSRRAGLELGVALAARDTARQLSYQLPLLPIEYAYIAAWVASIAIAIALSWPRPSVAESRRP